MSFRVIDVLLVTTLTTVKVVISYHRCGGLTPKVFRVLQKYIPTLTPILANHDATLNISGEGGRDCGC